MSEILVDNLTGKTSAGDITVTSEGGAATQSLQQGLAKAWVNFDGTGTIAARDSLNLSSLTDNNTGQYQINYSSSMSNANYSISGFTSAGTYLGRNSSLATGNVELLNRRNDNEASIDGSTIFFDAHGDLA